MKRLPKRNSRNNKMFVSILLCISIVLMALMVTIIIMSIPMLTFQEVCLSFCILFIVLLAWWLFYRGIRKKLK